MKIVKGLLYVVAGITAATALVMMWHGIHEYCMEHGITQCLVLGAALNQ